MTMPSDVTGAMARAHRDEMLRVAQAWNRTRPPRRRLRCALDRLRLILLRGRDAAAASPCGPEPAVAVQRV